MISHRYDHCQPVAVSVHPCWHPSGTRKIRQVVVQRHAKGQWPTRACGDPTGESSESTARVMHDWEKSSVSTGQAILEGAGLAAAGGAEG